MEFLAEYSLFVLKVMTLVIGILFLVAGIAAVTSKPKPKFMLTNLNDRYNQTKRTFYKKILGTKPDKIKKTKDQRPIMYVIDFIGDIKASRAESLEQTITAILSVAKKTDEVLVRLESPGGLVSGYGLAASALQRLRDKGIYLSVCIDKVAASGGYLMACVANQIIAAPFAIIGSIGVVAQIPNFHRLLKKKDIDVEILTAGEYKRTLTMFGENTKEGKQKFQEDIEQVHHQFKDHILQFRTEIDIEQVSTGEHWLAREAKGYHLVDKLQTSDDYITEKFSTHECFLIQTQEKASFADKLIKPFMGVLNLFVDQRLNLQ